MEPLTIATLKAITPNDVETYFFDDRIENIDYKIDIDIVSICSEAYTVQRAYDIADKFKRLGKFVVLGGYHTTALPNEASEHADSIIVGNAESVWEEFISDFKNKRTKKIYKGKTVFSSKLPDRSIFKGKRYLPLSLIETGRGCPNNCEFCSIASYYCSTYTPRKIEDIVAEIKQLKTKSVFFVDDNIFAQKNHFKNLCKAIIPLKIRWVTQTTLAIGADEELLKLAKKSGCKMVLIGLESMDKRNLDQMNKSWNYKLGESEKLIENIHKAGIGIYATFLFGFDYDKPENFRNTIDFALKHKFFFAAFNHLLPFPGTKLYDRLKSEKRLRIEKWWLDKNYKYGDIPYIPKNISPEDLKNFCANARREFFKPLNIIKRGIAQFLRNPDLFLLIMFFTQNFNLMREVDEKLNLPLASGLDIDNEK